LTIKLDITDKPATSSPARGSGPRYVAGEMIAEKYRLIEPLGEGGMGAVWVARNLALDVQVAIKVIRSDVDTPSAAERLLTEARAAARLKHPSIVRVFDFGRTRRGDPFIVMELLQGEDLGERIAREGRLSATLAVQLLLPIADALATAHAKRVIHRDLKPDNIFLSESDGRLEPKVVDFGIAKFELANQQHTPKLTQAGTVLGSPEYMSPEQARGIEDIDQRADVWAFSVVLYEAVTGSLPFYDASYNALLRRIIEDPPPSMLDFAAGDTELWAIVERGLEKDRDQRWQSMREIGERLALWLFSHGITEDVHGQSLRAAWLDGPPGSLPDTRLSSPFLEAPRLPSLSGLKPAPVRLTPTRAAAVTLNPEPVPARPRSRARAWLGVAAAVVVLLVAGVLIGRSMQARAPEPSEATNTGASEPTHATTAAAPQPVPAARKTPTSSEANAVATAEPTPSGATPSATNRDAPAAPERAAHPLHATTATRKPREKETTARAPAPSKPAKTVQRKAASDDDLGF
jgi:eukaryotic-like serine/threonine-protein kinase